MTWNYRIIEHNEKGRTYFAVHEVYYDKKGKITHWTQDPIDIVGDTAKEVAKTVQMILIDIKRPVLKESELEKKISKTGKKLGRALVAKERLFQVGVKALITNDEGKILVLDSGDWHLKHQKRHWDIPGGRIQEGYSALNTLKREVEEETGIKKMGAPEFFTAVISNFVEIPVGGLMAGLLLMIYKVQIPKSSEIILSSEHSGYEWVNKKEAAKRLAYKYPPQFTTLLGK